MAKVCPNCELTYSDDDFFCAADGSPLRSTGSDADNLVGTVIADRYRIESILGEGGMGRVYRARHVRVPREAAIKVLRRALIADSYAVAAFNREARNAASVGDHPNVASVYDFGETSDGLVFLAMEYIEGETLSRRLEREPVLSPRRAVEIIRQIAAGLTAAHELPEPVVHRDLKPDNILLKATRDGTDWVKVVDFGIAKAAKRDTQMLTTPGLVVGTPRYMSPEQLTGGAVDVRSDIYALGMIAFQMLTGRMPFASASRDEESSIQWALQRLTLKPLTLKQVRPDIDWPVAAQQALDGALATAAADRTASANEFARALAQGFGLTTPSGIVGVVAEAPGPLSSAVRSAAQSTAPTAPLPLATPDAPASVPSVHAPPSSPRGASNAAGARKEPGQSRSRTLLGAVAGVAIVAAIGAFIWTRGGSAGTNTNTATLARVAGPNDSTTQAAAQRPAQTTGARDSQPAAPAARDSATVAPPPPVEPPAPSPTSGRTPPAPPRGGTANAALAAQTRSGLDRAKAALADPDAVAAAGTGLTLIRDLRNILTSAPTRADSVEAMYYLVEANLILDRPRNACILLERLRGRSRGTPFEAGVDRFLMDTSLACDQRR